MECFVYTDNEVSVEDRTPVCDQNFCENCKRCLVCAKDESCIVSDDGAHYWVKYYGDYEDTADDGQ